MSRKSEASEAARKDSRRSHVPAVLDGLGHCDCEFAVSWTENGIFGWGRFGLGSGNCKAVQQSLEVGRR